MANNRHNLLNKQFTFGIKAHTGEGFLSCSPLKIQTFWSSMICRHNIHRVLILVYLTIFFLPFSKRTFLKDKINNHSH